MKNIIRQNFDRASTTYDKYDAVQQKAALNLVRKMMNICPKFNPDKILDIGCGTGNLIEELYHIFPNSTYHINDISTSMIEKTIKRFENIIEFSTIPGCIEEINLKTSYDLIVSNMCLQWVDNLDFVIDNLLNRTKLLTFSCLLEDSFKEWYNLLERYNIQHVSRLYPSQKEIHALIYKLNKNILHESKNIHNISFNNSIESAKYLKNLGANSPRYSIYDPSKVVRLFKEHNQICTLNYNVGFFIIEGRL